MRNYEAKHKIVTDDTLVSAAPDQNQANIIATTKISHDRKVSHKHEQNEVRLCTDYRLPHGVES